MHAGTFDKHLEGMLTKNVASISSQEAQQNSGKLVNRGCHAAHPASSLDQRLEKARPPGSANYVWSM